MGNRYNGFSLAEMLLVLLIMSFLAMAVAPFSVKKIKKDTSREPHGRFECYWNSDGRLIQYRTLEKGEPTMEDRTNIGYCEFEPVDHAAYYMLQAVGGGAGGSHAGEEPEVVSFNAQWKTNHYGTLFYGFQIPCSDSKSWFGTAKWPWWPTSFGYWNVSNTYSNTCSGSIPESFSDSEDETETGNKWDWVNNLWDKYTPTITFTVCSGAGSGGSGVSKTLQLASQGTPGEDDYIDCDREKWEVTDTNGDGEVTPEDNIDPCYVYPTADGGDGGKGLCATFVDVPLPRGSAIYRSNFDRLYPGNENGFDWNENRGAQGIAGKSMTIKFGNQSCVLSGGQKGANGAIDSVGNATPGADGADAVAAINPSDAGVLLPWLDQEDVPDDEKQYYVCTPTSSDNTADYLQGGAGATGFTWSPTTNGNNAWVPGSAQWHYNYNPMYWTHSDPYIPIEYSYMRASNYFGIAGGMGEYRLMFFPELRQNVRIRPGRGGTASTVYEGTQNATAGGDTVAWWSTSSESTPFVFLAGGAPTNRRVPGKYFTLYSQEPVYCDATRFSSGGTGGSDCTDPTLEVVRQSAFADFISALSSDTGTVLRTTMPERARPGRGGDGGYTILRDTRNLGYRKFNGMEFDENAGDDDEMNEDFSYSEQEYNPNWQRSITCHPERGPENDSDKVTDTMHTFCAPQNGEDGAAVIIW